MQALSATEEGKTHAKTKYQFINFVIKPLFNRKISKMKNFIKTAFFILLLHNQAFSQLIVEKSPSQVSLTSSEQTFVQKIVQLPDTKTAKYISIGDVAQYESNGDLNFTLPGVVGSLQSKAVHVEYNGPDDNVWSAKFINQPGYLSIIRKPEGQSGFFQMVGKYFSIIPINETTSLLKEYDLAHLSSEDCGVGEEMGMPRERDWCEPADNNCFSEINILVLVTPDVQNWFAGVPNQWQTFLTILQGFESINFAFANSGIVNKNVRLRWENFAFNGFDMPLDIVGDLNTDLPVQAEPIREQRQADVVIMLTSMNYPSIAGAAINPTSGCPSDACSYAIVEIQSIDGPRFTFAHEFAHLLGANHNRGDNCSAAGVCGDNDDDVCAHARVFNGAGGAEHRTILALMTEPGAVRIPQYSNADPAFGFDGVATGDEDNDNSRLIKNAACYTDDYNSADWTVGISGPVKWCTSEPSHTLSAAVTPPTPGWGYSGNPPYQYEWRWSCSPTFVNSQFLSNQPSATLTNPLAGGGDEIWVQLTVTSSDGATRVRNRPVVVIECPSVGGGTGDRSSNPEMGNASSYISVSPNPVSDILEIAVDVDEGQISDIILLDNLGSVVKQVVKRGAGKVNVDTHDLQSGIYFVLIKKPSVTEAHKIIVQH